LIYVEQATIEIKFKMGADKALKDDDSSYALFQATREEERDGI
jgi:hypothetical protein